MREADRATPGATTSRGVLLAAFALIALGGTFVLALYALTPTAQRPGLLEDIRPLIVAAVAGLPAVVSAVLVQGVRRETREQTGRLHTIERQTNGELRATVQDIVTTALRDHLPVQRLPVVTEIVTSPAPRHAMPETTQETP